MKQHGISERRACLLVGVNRATVRYKGRRLGDKPVDGENTKDRFGKKEIWLQTYLYDAKKRRRKD